MSFVHSSASRVLLNETSQSAQITGCTVTHSRAVAPTTTLADSGARFIPGLMGGSVSVKGLFDSAAGSLHSEIQSVIGTDNGALWAVLPDGGALGAPAFIAVSDISGYAVDAQVSDAVGLTIDATPDDGVDIGVVLHALGAETADVNSTGVDNAASSANGGVASLHVTAYSGLTNAVIKVQHSTNNSTWADLATFTTVTAVTSERLLVAAGTTVNRYTRSFLDVTGTGSITFALAFARR
jgi:hypothetical protein